MTLKLIPYPFAVQNPHIDATLVTDHGDGTIDCSVGATNYTGLRYLHSRQSALGWVKVALTRGTLDKPVAYDEEDL